jgi:maleate cis-trans isomerase
MYSELYTTDVTSNQAMVWHCLKELGVRTEVKGYGRLFDSL